MHIKLIAARCIDETLPKAERNIDIQRVALVVFPTGDDANGPSPPPTIRADLLYELDLLTPPLQRWNILCHYHYHHIQEHAVCVLFLADAALPDAIAARDCLHSICQTGTYKPLRFFWCDAASSVGEVEFIRYVATERASTGMN